MRKGWTETTLGELVKIQKGKKPPALDVREEASHPYLTADVLRGATCEQFVAYALTGLCIQLSGRETVLLWDGAGAGDVFKSQPGILASTMAKLEARDSLAMDDGYLYLYLNFKQVMIKSSCRGTTVPHVSPEALKALYVSLPPLAEQKRIVDVVSSLDAYVDALQQQADTLRTVRSAVLHELLTAGGDDWTETTISEVLLISIGGIWGEEIGTDELDVRVYRQTEFNDNGKLTVPSDAIRSISPNQLKSRRIEPGDILLQKSAGTPSLPGRVVRVPEGIEDDATCSNFLQLIRADSEKCDPMFLFWELWFRHKSGGAFEFQRGTNIKNLDLNQYFAQQLHLPPLAEQQRVVEIVSFMDEVIQSTEQAVIDAKNLRSGVLSDLLSGEHEIPESYDRLLGAA